MQEFDAEIIHINHPPGGNPELVENIRKSGVLAERSK